MLNQLCRTIVGLAALALAACSGSEGGDPGTAGPTPPPPAPVQTSTVRLLTSGGNRFEPANIGVAVGTTVTSAGNPGFLSSGDAVSSPDNGMRGTITVR